MHIRKNIFEIIIIVLKYMKIIIKKLLQSQYYNNKNFKLEEGKKGESDLFVIVFGFTLNQL